MANVNIKFNNKDYLLSCDDGQEESLKKLTKFLDKKYSELKDKLGNIGENKLLLITTIQLIDEYFDLKQKVTQQKTKLDEISKKFKEIRSLAIDYKKYKEFEIEKLTKHLDELKKENLIVFKYCDEKGNINENSNPNGSLENIAGILNKKKNILGMMPHPERMVEEIISNKDGVNLFSSLLN